MRSSFNADLSERSSFKGYQQLKGRQLLTRRITNIPNIKNYKNLKFIDDINEHYSIGKKIGSGNYGVVSEAVSITTGNKYAIKTILKSSLDNKRQAEFMNSELNVH